jgi:hypothetical protein
MKLNLHLASLPALALLLALSSAPASFAQDAMAPAADPMAPAADAMAPANAMGTITPMSDSDFATCQQEAGTLTFPAVKMAAMAACDGLHKGMDVMGAIQSMQSHDAMTPDAMVPTDSMAPADAMAPVAQ